MSSPPREEARIVTPPRMSRSPTNSEKGKQMDTGDPGGSADLPTGSETAPSGATALDTPDNASIAATSISNPALEIDSVPDNIINEHGNDNNSDADSAVGGMEGSSTQSVRSSLYDYVEENGRAYHRYKQGKYPLPNDASEQDRLDLQHQLALILLEGKLFLAPIGKSPHWVLDVGTGTGIWAIEFAVQFPSAQVIGTDLSPIQPLFVPPNCAFEVDDAEDDWIFTQKFNFIHIRAMMTCFQDPRSIIAKSYEALAPGGWLELQDAIFPLECRDDTFEGTALEEWTKYCIQGAERMGRRWTHVQYYKDWMEELGFEDVRVKIYEIPINTWPKGAKAKALGMWWQADLLEGLGATMAVLTRGLGWSLAKAERFLEDVRKDVNNRAIHAYMPIHFVWGRKPKHRPDE